MGDKPLTRGLPAIAAADMRRLVGRNVARIRRAKGLSQMELAGRSGLSQQYLSGLERGKRNPTVVTLCELAQALGIGHVEIVAEGHAARTDAFERHAETGLEADEALGAGDSSRPGPVSREPSSGTSAEAKPRSDFLVWDPDPAAWDRMQRQAGSPATGDPAEAWKQIDHGLFFTYAQQSQRSLPSLAEIRAEKRRMLRDFDAVLGHLHGDASPSAPGLSVNPLLFDWLIREAMYQLRPGEPRLPENRRGESVPLHAMMLLLRGPYRDVQVPAQNRVVDLLKQADQALGPLSELLAASLAADAAGRGPGLAARAFVAAAAAAYETAYGLPAAPGGKEAAGRSSPAVRFAKSVLDEARRAETIGPSFRDPLRTALGQVTLNTINRLLSERSARRRGGPG